jgi:hypothetical protein
MEGRGPHSPSIIPRGSSRAIEVQHLPSSPPGRSHNTMQSEKGEGMIKSYYNQGQGDTAHIPPTHTVRPVQQRRYNTYHILSHIPFSHKYITSSLPEIGPCII